MKYEITYRLHNQSKLFSAPKKIVVNDIKEKRIILNKCKVFGYEVEQVRKIDKA